MSCWKCGKELPTGQTECEYGCGVSVVVNSTHDTAQVVVSLADKLHEMNQCSQQAAAMFAEIQERMRLLGKYVFKSKDGGEEFE
jgi:hypothetical protein